MTIQLQKSLKATLLLYAAATSLFTTNVLLDRLAVSRSGNWVTVTSWIHRSGFYERQNASLFLTTTSQSNSVVHGHALPDLLFLQKAFGKTMQPTSITPYYYRASQTPDADDITITTQITSDRFGVFAKLVDSYQGPISVTVHVTDSPERRDWTLAELGALYSSHPLMSRWVDVHLIIDNFERQFNMWRNVGRLFARTDYVFMLDVDFIVCRDLRQRLHNDTKLMDILRKGETALVLPAFEYIDQKNGLDAGLFPSRKEDLLSLVDQGETSMFHSGWELGHGNTDYPRWYKTRAGEHYPAKTYQHSYEPYFIMKKQGIPWCDERFVGYGANKAACLFEIYLSRISLYVLSDDFLIHQSHMYPHEVRKNEACNLKARRYNRKLYTRFPNETCARWIDVKGSRTVAPCD
ncbi:glycosyltransferase family 49 protein [Tulasnella calospora MUT 4182]|uniref:Glycosyltransferase family 49 protein n=1 Tax=Tulasnella calospora MUT 4182 TaxID=1051891 RepID=A0A0C3QXX4_9AGAM|nr:glycosyltransferase family 49 protein [Tulasnella calospora MUT 4182]